MISASGLVFSQKICKKAIVHAYIRNSMPGNFPSRDVNEKGEVPRPIKPVTSYHIYLEKPADDIQVSRVWLNGESYSVTVEQVDQTPIIVAGGQVGKYQRNDTIVTKTNKVLRLILKEKIDKQPSAKLSEIVSKNPVVVEFQRGKKQYFNFSPQLKKLQPLVLQ